MPIDISELDSEVLGAVRERLGCDDPDDQTHDKEISSMSPEEVFNSYLEWHGIIGYSASIRNAMESIKRASSKQGE